VNRAIARFILRSRGTRSKGSGALQRAIGVTAANAAIASKSLITHHCTAHKSRFTETQMLLLIIILVLLFGGGGGYYGYSRWGTGGGLGIVGTVLLIVLVVYLLGGLR
jgi:hypothetical protein